MEIIANSCTIPKDDRYSWMSKDRRPSIEVYPTSYIWCDLNWTINVIEKCALSNRITVERIKDPYETNRTGLYCPQQLVGDRAFQEIRELLKLFKEERTEVNFCYPNEKYYNQSIFCGVRSVVKTRLYTLSDMNRKNDPFLYK